VVGEKVIWWKKKEKDRDEDFLEAKG